MKNIIVSLIAAALCVQAQAQVRTLSTTDGATYAGITFQRVEPDGLYIEYRFAGGGMGMSKVKFSRMFREQQKQFGFNKREAREYEATVAQANDDAAQDLIHRSQVLRDARRQRDAENQSAYPGRMAEITRLNAAQAAAFYRTTAAEGIPNSSLTYGTTFGATIPETRMVQPSGQGDLFPNRGTVTTHR